MPVGAGDGLRHALCAQRRRPGIPGGHRPRHSARSDSALACLITHGEYEAYKIRIAGVGTDRLARHIRDHWQTYRTLRTATGDEAFLIEQDALRFVRQELRLPPYLDEQQMPQTGWTETVCSDEIALPDLWQVILDCANELGTLKR